MRWSSTAPDRAPCRLVSLEGERQRLRVGRAAWSGVSLLVLFLSHGAADATVIHRGPEDPAMVPCETHSDCPPGLGCVPDDVRGLGEDPGSWCLPRLCEEDGDCDGGTICLSAPGAPCSGAQPCEEETLLVCGPPWLSPCEQHSDCGHPDIRCMEQMSCTNGGRPTRGEEGESVEAECEPLGVFRCEFDIQLCEIDGDCPETWRCFEAVGGDITVNYEVPCPEDQRDGEGDQCLQSGGPPEDGRICLPGDYRVYVGWSGGVAPMAEPRLQGSPDGDVSADRSSSDVSEGHVQRPSNAGCGAQGEAPRTLWPLMILGWLVVGARLKAVPFDGRMRSPGSSAEGTVRGD